MQYTELVKKAFNICCEAHANQKDKCGYPYIFHPIHIAEQMDTEYEICVALLHDVVEDTDYTIEDLKKSGFPSEIVDAVKCITRDKDMSYFEYIKIVKENELAKKVKLVDLAHNSDPDRQPDMDEATVKRLKKYEKAKQILME